MLLNECEPIARDDQRIFLAGVDDAHFYRMDNIEKAVAQIPEGAFSILLSHTPEIYRQAVHAHFRLMLSGHTHGGQLCLPGSIPIMLEAVLAKTDGGGRLAVSRDDRLHLGGGGDERRSRAPQLPA